MTKIIENRAVKGLSISVFSVSITPQQTALGQHKRCVHKGVRYACDKCEILQVR